MEIRLLILVFWTRHLIPNAALASIPVRPTLTHRVFCFPKELSLTRAYYSIIGVLVEWGLLLVFMVGVGKQVRDCLY